MRQRVPELIATAEFTDGGKRAVYEDNDRQFVIEDRGQRVYGVWVIPREECDTPIVVGDDLPADW
jgi:hypothetical protein